MARTGEGAELTARHRRAQLQIRSVALRDYMRIWPLWEGDRRSFGRLVDATLPLVSAHHDLSAAVAVAYYEAFRRRERVPGRGTPKVAGLEREKVATSLYVTGAAMTSKALLAGQSPREAMRTALTRTSMAVTRHVLAGGRDTLIGSTLEDEQAEGWARVTDSSPCPFCAMLAGRGPVYKESTAGFRAHDGCGCTVETRYEGAEWPGRAREFRDLYDRAVREAREQGELRRGTSNDSLNAFRRLLERQPA